ADQHPHCPHHCPRLAKHPVLRDPVRHRLHHVRLVRPLPPRPRHARPARRTRPLLPDRARDPHLTRRPRRRRPHAQPRPPHRPLRHLLPGRLCRTPHRSRHRRLAVGHPHRHRHVLLPPRPHLLRAPRPQPSRHRSPLRRHPRRRLPARRNRAVPLRPPPRPQRRLAAVHWPARRP